MDKYGVDLGPILVPDVMSDEASGPEDEPENLNGLPPESVSDWKRRMAKHAGMAGRTDAQLKRTTFLETVAPNWRSAEVRKR